MTDKICSKCHLSKPTEDFLSAGATVCHDCRKARERERYQKRREHYRAYYREYYKKNKEKIYTQQKIWERKNRTKMAAYHRDYGRKQRIILKAEILTQYGNGKLACVLCGENRPDCLSVDHINGNGNQHRRKIKISSGYSFYWWLKKNNFPEGYQTLCFNCQWIKEIERRRANWL